MNDNYKRFASGALFSFAILSLCLPAARAADSDQEPVQESYRCESGKAFRLFSLNYPETELGGGCQVLYEKSDTSEPVRALWRAKYDLQFCVDRMRSSVTKLVDAGWTCQQSDNAVGGQVAKVTPDLKKPILIDKMAVASPSDSSIKTAVVVEPEKETLEYDDWFHRWDEASRRLVFTLSNTIDGSKVRSYAWRHQGLSKEAKQPSNVVFIQNQKARPLLIVVWPSDNSQFVTAIDPIRQDKPFCEIETQVLGDKGWGFGIENGAMVLTGQRSLPGQPGQLETVREQCPLSDATG
jgi:hypothetical protein